MMIIYSFKYNTLINSSLASIWNSRYSILSELFLTTNWSKLLFYPIFLSRRIAIALAIIFTNGIIQILVSIVFCTMVNLNRNFLYLVLNNPFTAKKDFILHIVNEVAVFTFYFMILIQEIDFIELDAAMKTSIYVKIVYAVLAFNLLFSFNDIIQKIASLIKSRRGSAKVIHLDNIETGIESKNNKSL